MSAIHTDEDLCFHMHGEGTLRKCCIRYEYAYTTQARRTEKVIFLFDPKKMSGFFVLCEVGRVKPMTFSSFRILSILA